MKDRTKSCLEDILLLFIVALPAILPLFTPGYLLGHDAWTNPWRSLVLNEALKAGLIYPRWSHELFFGYGFPLFNYYPPLYLYPTLFLNSLTGSGFLEANKTAYAINIVASGIGAYVLARIIISHRVFALAAAIFYMYAPYVLGDVYVRSSLGGSTGLTVLPWLLASSFQLSKDPKPFWVGTTSLLVGVNILTHLITGVMALAMIAGLVLLRYMISRDKQYLLLSTVTIALGLGLSSICWLPALSEMDYVRTDKLSTHGADYRNHFVDPTGEVDQSWRATADSEPYMITKWGLLDLHAAYPYGHAPYKLSLFQGLLLLVAMLALLMRRKNISWEVVSLFLLAWGFIFLTTSWSRTIWETFPSLGTIQFPWRFLGPASLCIAIVGSWGLSSLFPRGYRLSGLALVELMMMFSSLWFLPTQLSDFVGGLRIDRASLLQYEYQERYKWGTHHDNQFLPKWVQWEGGGIAEGDLIWRYDQAFPRMQWVGEAAYIPSGSKAWIVAARRGQGWMEAVVEAGDVTRLTFHTLYFPGWTVYIDGQRGQVEASPWQEFEEGRKAALGVCQVDVPEGRHLVRLVFEDTPVRLMAKVVSALGILGVGSLFVVAYWRRGEGVRSGRLLVLLLLIWVLVAGVSYAAYRWLASSRAASVEWVDNRVVRDFVKGAEERILELDAPLGAKADDYVHPRVFTIGGESRSVVYMHPSSSAGAKVWLPEGARLEFGVGVDPAVWDKAGDGVEFEVLVGEGGAIRKVYSRYIDPKGNPDDRRWIDEAIDLDGYAHREVEVVLRTQPGATGEFDWAGWAEPRITIP